MFQIDKKNKYKQRRDGGNVADRPSDTGGHLTKIVVVVVVVVVDRHPIRLASVPGWNF